MNPTDPPVTLFGAWKIAPEKNFEDPITLRARVTVRIGRPGQKPDEMVCIFDYAGYTEFIVKGKETLDELTEDLADRSEPYRPVYVRWLGPYPSTLNLYKMAGQFGPCPVKDENTEKNCR